MLLKRHDIDACLNFDFARMDVGELFLSCFASTYFDYVRQVGRFFAAAERVQLGQRCYTLGRQLGAGGAADVHLATAEASLGASDQYALKKARPCTKLRLIMLNS